MKLPEHERKQSVKCDLGVFFKVVAIYNSGIRSKSGLTRIDMGKNSLPMWINAQNINYPTHWK
jgi:hypothetical protein